MGCSEVAGTGLSQRLSLGVSGAARSRRQTLPRAAGREGRRSNISTSEMGPEAHRDEGDISAPARSKTTQSLIIPRTRSAHSRSKPRCPDPRLVSQPQIIPHCLADASSPKERDLPATLAPAPAPPGQRETRLASTWERHVQGCTTCLAMPRRIPARAVLARHQTRMQTLQPGCQTCLSKQTRKKESRKIRGKRKTCLAQENKPYDLLLPPLPCQESGGWNSMSDRT